jgi:hypothetical protein
MAAKWFSTLVLKPVRQAREPAHRHPHREILALHVDLAMRLGSGSPLSVLQPMHTAGLVRLRKSYGAGVAKVRYSTTFRACWCRWTNRKSGW